MSGLKSLFGDKAESTAAAFPAAADHWGLSFIGYPLKRNDDDELLGEFNYLAGDEHADWNEKSLLLAVDEARAAVNLSQSDETNGWFSSVGWPGINEVSIIPYLDSAEQLILEMIDYLLAGDFGPTSEELGDAWWDPVRTDIDLSTDFPDPDPGSSNVTDADYPTVTKIDTNPGIFRPHDSVDGLGQPAPEHWRYFTPAQTDWANPTTMQILLDFIYDFANDADVDPIVAKYRAAIEAEYTREAQRATSILHFGGAANTSPAALSFWRRTEEIERQVAAFRAELLNRLIPSSDSVVGMFNALANDSARIDNTKLQLNQQILQGNIARMDAFIEVALGNLNKELQEQNSNAGYDTQVSIAGFDRRISGEIQMILAALDARVRVGTISDNTKLEVARLLIALYQNLASMKQQRASVVTELRREYQTNRLKMYMWKIELAETLMNAAVVPLGVPMQPPLPSQFETRMAAGIQTFVNVAGTLAPSGNPALAIGGGLALGLLTTFLPRNIGRN